MKYGRINKRSTAWDVVWIDFNPQAGHEQAGRRPAIVLTTKDFNDKTSLVVLCPITRSSTPDLRHPLCRWCPNSIFYLTKTDERAFLPNPEDWVFSPKIR